MSWVSEEEIIDPSTLSTSPDEGTFQIFINYDELEGDRKKLHCVLESTCTAVSQFLSTAMSCNYVNGVHLLNELISFACSNVELPLETSDSIVQLFGAYLDYFFALYENFDDDADLHIEIFKYLGTFSSLVGENIDPVILQSIFKYVEKSLKKDDRQIVLSIFGGSSIYKYSRRCARRWKTFRRLCLRGLSRKTGWKKHVCDIPESIQTLPDAEERTQAIKMMQVLCYNTRVAFNPYIEPYIKMLMVSIHDISIPVKCQTLETLSNLLVYKMNNGYDNEGDSNIIFSSTLCALEFLRWTTDTELTISSLECIELYLNFCGKLLSRNKKVVSKIFETLTNIIEYVQDVYLVMNKDLSDIEIERLAFIKSMCANIIPCFANVVERDAFSEFFCQDVMMTFFESTLHERKEEWDTILVNARIDAAGVIGDCVKIAGNTISRPDAIRILKILRSVIFDDDQDHLVRSNAFYSCGELFFHNDQTLKGFMSETVEEFVEFAKKNKHTLSDREASNMLGALAKMIPNDIGSVNLNDVNICNFTEIFVIEPLGNELLRGLGRMMTREVLLVLEIFFMHLPLQDDFDEYENILCILFLIVDKSDKKYLHPLLDTIQHVKFVEPRGDICNFIDTMEEKIRNLLPEPEEVNYREIDYIDW